MDYEKLKNWNFADVDATYSDRETMLYALGLGLGAEPTDAQQLRFVTETALQALPTLSTVVARHPPWLPHVGVRVTDAVHGEHRMSFARALAPQGRLRASASITGIVDKGPGKGLLVVVEQKIFDAASGELLATSAQTNFIRGAGGVGGPTDPGPAPHPLPQRAADMIDCFATLPQQSLIYRLSGDRNPLHFDPAIARAAGFPRPILHGFCTYGIACWQIVKRCCGYDTARLAALDVRFSGPALPGETLVTELWRDVDIVSFRTTTAERGTAVLANGRAVIRS